MQNQPVALQRKWRTAPAAPISAPATLHPSFLVHHCHGHHHPGAGPDLVHYLHHQAGRHTEARGSVTDHQLFFPRPFALGPKLPTANMSTYTHGGRLLRDARQCFSPRSFAASSPTIGVGDQSFLAAATEQQAPALPGASGCLPWHQVVAPPTPTTNTPPYVTRSPPPLSLSLSAPQLPCPWPSAFVRAVIGLYGAAFMGTSTPSLPVAPQPRLPTRELPGCSFEICNNQGPEKVCRTTSDTMPFTTYFLDYKIPPQCSIADHLVLEVFEPNKIPVKMSFNVFLLYQRKISGSGS